MVTDKLLNLWHFFLALKLFTDNLAARRLPLLARRSISSLSLSPLSSSARYKLLNKTLLGELTSFLDDAALRESVPRLSALRFYLASSPRLPLLCSVPFSLKETSAIECMSSTLLLWYQFPPAIPITRTSRRCKIQPYVCADPNENSERSWNETNNGEFMRERTFPSYPSRLFLRNIFRNWQ